MGVGAATAAEARRSLARQREADWCEPAPPVLVVRSAAPPGRFPIALPRPAGRTGRGAPQVSIETVMEDGARRLVNFSAGEVAHLGTRTYRDRAWDRYEVPLPGPFPLGYHTLNVAARRDDGVLQRAVALIVCPERAYEAPEADGGARAAGLGVALYGVRSGRNTGVGDLGDLRRLTRWATRALGVRFIGLNPLHAIRNRYPYAHSPYLPLSSRFANHLYLELEAIPEFAASDAAQLQMADAAPLLARLRATPHVPYDEADGFKLRVLRTLFAEFLAGCWNRAGGSARRKRFEDYLAREGQALEQFALFQAIDAHLVAAGECGWSWRLWPEGFRRPDGPEARAFLERRREEVLFWQYVQWQLDEQLGQLNRDADEAGLTLGYYHDLALAVDGSGADTWAQQELFAAGARVGAPPDDFNTGGTGLGLPAPAPAARPRAGLPRVCRSDPQRLPPRRPAAHRPRDAPRPPLLGARQSARLRRGVRPLPGVGSLRHPRARERAQPHGHRRRGPGRRPRRFSRDHGRREPLFMPPAVVRAPRRRRLPGARRSTRGTRWSPSPPTTWPRSRGSGPGTTC